MPSELVNIKYVLTFGNAVLTSDIKQRPYEIIFLAQSGPHIKIKSKAWLRYAYHSE